MLVQMGECILNSHEKPVAIVTGAAQGIGRAIACKLAGQGARIIAVDNNEAAGTESTDTMRTAGLAVEFIKADVGVVADIKRVISLAAGHYGRLDWIVNNAGISLFKAIEEIEVEEFDRILAVNLRPAFLFAKFGLPLLSQSRQAAIVNISSTRALMSEPHNESYAAAKAGLLGLTHALANSLGPKVRVNAICPGWIDVSLPPAALLPADHAQHLVGRIGHPDDIAHGTAFLLSAEAAFITGQVFVIDGGMTKKMIYAE